MTQVYIVGLPVFLKCLGEGLIEGGDLGGLLEGVMDRMVLHTDLVPADAEAMSTTLLPAILELLECMADNEGDAKF